MGAKQLVRRAVLASPARSFFEPRFVIVGSGRSGTGYIAALLREVGIRCGHENWWSLRADNQSLRLEGDASWIATFQLADYDGQVFHQIRDPIKVMNSHYSDLTTGHERGRQVCHFRSQWIELTGEVTFDVLLIYVAWVRKAEQIAEWTWRLEDIDASLLATICDRIGWPIGRIDAERAVLAVATDTNRHADQQLITWDDLPNSDLKTEAMSIASDYGYL